MPPDLMDSMSVAILAQNIVQSKIFSRGISTQRDSYTKRRILRSLVQSSNMMKGYVLDIL